MDIYFLRHGLAGDRENWKGDDTERPLTKAGKTQMAREGVTLAALGIKPDRILTSPLVRARQTARILAKKLDAVECLAEDERLAPGFGALQLAEILRDQPKANSLVLVGHEPDFSQTIGQLTGVSRLVLKKGGLARVTLADAANLSGDLVWLAQPKLLARGS